MPTVTAADLLRARSSGSVHSLGEDSLSSLQPKDRQRHRLTRHHETTVIVMVGLPARGKSFISKKVERFLSWRGDQVKIFNVGDRRRKHSSAQESKHDAAFFSKETAHVREEIAHGVLMEMIHWLMTGEDVPSPNSRAAAPTAPAAAAPATPKPLAAPGSVDISDAAKATTTPRAERTAGFGMPLNTSVEPRRPGIARAESEEEREHVAVPRPTRTAIFDATNTTKVRRKSVQATLARELPSCRVVFVESICDDDSVLERNLAQKIAMSPDYQGMDVDAALADLRQRITRYEEQYETLTVPERLSFIKLFNLSSQLHLNMIYGSVAKSLVPYMMGIHIGRRPIWLVRSAQAEGVTPPGTPESDRPNKLVVVKRSAGLSSDGLMFAQRLARFVEQKCAEFANAHAELYDGTPTPQPPMPSQINSTAANPQLSSSPPSSGLQGATPNRQRTGGCGGLTPTEAAAVGAYRTSPPSESPTSQRPQRRTTSGEWMSASADLSGHSMDILLAQELDAAAAEGRLAEDAANPAFHCAVFTSTLPRAIQTASFVEVAEENGRPHATPALNPIDRGVAYGLTEEQFERQLPEDFERWRNDVRHTRFPGGESYADLLQRIEPFLIELEQQTSPVLVVSHLSTLQALSSYFTGSSLEEALKQDVPYHTVLQLTPAAEKMMWAKTLIPLTEKEDEVNSLAGLFDGALVSEANSAQQKPYPYDAWNQ